MVLGLNTEHEILIDTAAVNAKYAKYRDDPRRWWTGVTQADSDCQGESLQRKLYEASGRFIEAMGKRGWDLQGKVYVAPAHSVRDMATGAVILGKFEYAIRGLFKMAHTPKPDRIEIPAGLVKREPDQKITLSEAVKAL